MAYTKTIWEDLPSTNTPINATNLNKIENGIETNSNNITTNTTNITNLTPVTLYNNTSGTSDNITLTNDSFSNYTRVKIFGFDNYGNQVNTEFLPAINKNVELISIVTGSGTHYIFTQEYSFSSTTLTKYRKGYSNIQNETYSYNGDGTMFITKIIGYK